MTSPNPDDKETDNGKSEASLFEAISHETRIRILFLLRDHALGFSDLKHELVIKSGGNLQHHLGKLGTLVCLDEESLYALTDHGREAVMAIHAVRRTQNREKSDRIIIGLVYAFAFYIGSMNAPFLFGTYIGSMNAPFLFGTVNAQIPLFSLWMAMFMGIFMYLAWPWIHRRSQRNKS